MRNKLLIAAVIANLAGMIAAVYVARLIRDVPADASTETMLLVAYYTALCVVAVADALLVDEFMFGGAFRLTHLQGKDPKYARASDDAAMVAATMQRSSVSFPIVLLLSGGLTYLLFNFVNQDFNSYYRRVGIHVSSLRGDDPENQPRRLQAIAELSVRRHPTIVPTLRQQLARGGEVGAWGAWALGRFIDVTSERKAILGDLRAALKSPDPNLRREALISLARYQDRDVADQLIGELERDLAAGVIDRRLLIAAGYIQVPKLLPVLQQILQRGDERAQRVAAWAIAQHRDQREAKDLDTMLTDRLPSAAFPVRCAIVFSLGILGNERANVPLMHAYDTATPEERTTTCPVEVVYLRPDNQQDHFELLLPVDNYENQIFKVLGQIRATSPEIRAEVEPWLERLVAAHKGDGTLKADRAQSLLEGIRSARDDSKLAAPE
ncbi:HEAT repeat domain-containing protein [Nannocystis pusilla]|uniref:HEAT repeat domain-containing protein n=1 Tax=Nannocystis pusilla TaxID=889268 RepID=UPI003DA4C1FE